MRRVLVVAGAPDVRCGVGGLTRARGLQALEAENGAAAERVLLAESPDVAVVDLSADGELLDVLPRLRALDPDLPILGLARPNSPETAAQGIHGGASLILPAPVEPALLYLAIERSIEERRARRIHEARWADRPPARDPFIGSDAVIRQLEAEAGMAIRAGTPILIHGPAGSGKRVMAEWLHRNGPRAREPLAMARCSGRPAGRMASDLFGNAPGAFGNPVAEAGRIEAAHHGSVLFECIDQADANLQAELLRVIETGRIRRRGDSTDRSVDVGIMASTRRDLLALVSANRFREDLYHRLCATALRMPALEERRESIPALARAMLDELALRGGEPLVPLTAEAERWLQAAPWPGNLRELRNTLECALRRSEGAAIAPAHLGDGGAAASAMPELDQPIAEVERRHIERVLEAEGGHVGRAGKRLGIPRSTLYQRLKQLGISTGRR